MSPPAIPRRTFLKGAGAALALPLLEGMLPAPCLAGEPAGPVRLLFVFTPNGMHMPDWTPATEGADFGLPYLLEPLAPWREQLFVPSGLALDNARSKGDGPGDHARAGAAFLTTAHPKKTGGADIRLGVSVDQVAAAKVGRATRFPSLELGTEPSRQAGACDSGYSCAYSSNVSWRTPTQPLAKEVDPRLVFERLFLTEEARLSPEERERRRRYRRSVLDLVGEDAARLSGRLGRTDRRKLGEYAHGVRELERQIEAAAAEAAELPDFDAPRRAPRDYGRHVRLMYDLVGLAFEADLTRVATIMVGNAGSNRSYRDLGVPEGHHSLSHHGGDAEKQAKIRRINRWHTEQLAHLVERLATTPEGDGSLLDRTLVVYGSGIGDGNRHNHDDLPILLIGGAKAGVTPGRHVRYRRDTPLANLYLALLARAGVHAGSFGDSDGPLPGLQTA